MSDSEKKVEVALLSDKEKFIASAISAVALFLIIAVICHASARPDKRAEKKKEDTKKVTVQVRESNDIPAPITPPAAIQQNDTARSFNGSFRVETPTPSESRTLFGLNDADIKFILTILATVFGGFVTYIGHVFTRAHNERTYELNKIAENRLQMETARNATLKANETRNQQVETLVKWVGLLGTSEGKDASQGQQAAALLVLAKFGHVELALTYLESMWAANRVDSACGVSVVNEGIKSDDQKQQDFACQLLLSNAKNLATADGDYLWPASIDWQWNVSLSWIAREYILRSLLLLITSRPKTTWDIDSLRGTFVNIHAAMTSDSDPCIQEGAAMVAQVLLPVVTDDAKFLFLADSKFHTISEIQDEITLVLRKNASGQSNATTTVRNLVSELETWSNG